MVNQAQSLKQYGRAIAYVMIALLFMLALDPLLKLAQFGLLFWLGAIALSAWSGGWRAGMVATLLSAVLVSYFGLAAQSPGPLGSADILKLVLFVAEAGLITALISSGRGVQAKTLATLAESEASHQTLRHRVEHLEHQLTAANERFSLAAKAVNCLIYDWDLISDRVERTDGLLQLVGYSLEEAEPTGKWWGDRIHPDDFSVLQDQALVVLATEDHYSGEYRVLNRSNQYIYVLDKCLVVARNPEGQPIRMVGSTTDITERKRAEAERQQAELQLQESQRFIQQIADSVAGTLYVYDMLEQRNVYVNRQIGELLGYTPEQIQAFGDQLFPQLIHPDDFANLATQLERVNQAQDGEVVDYEYRMRHANGEWRWLWSRNTVSTRTPDGQAQQVVGTVQDISDRKQIEADLERRELEFRTLVENTPDIITRYDADLRHLYISPNVEQAIGLSPDQILGKTAAAMGLSNPEMQVWYATVQQVFDTGKACLLETKFPRLDGELRLYQAHFVPELTEGDRVKTVVSFSRDITDYKRAEASLRQSEERLRLAMEAARMGTWDVDLITGKAVWSEQHFTLLGYEPVVTREASEAMWIDRIHPEDREQVLQRWQQARVEHQLYRAEYRVRRADNGQIAWIAALGNFAYNLEGQAVRSLGVVSDITNRKQAEEAVLTLNQQLQDKVTELQTLLDMIPVGIGIAEDPDCNFIRVNPAFAKLLTIPPTDNASLTAPETERPKVFRVYQNGREMQPDELPLQRAARQGVEVRGLEVEVVRQDGSVVSLLEHAVPLFDQSGRPRGSIGAFLDITDRKQAEAEREQLLKREQAAREEAERVNRVKDEFLAILSHELRSPLNPILGWSKLLQTQQLDAAKTQQALATIERNAKLQAQLIDDLLDIARILRGKLKLSETPVDLALVVEAALEVVKTAAQAKSIELRLDLSDLCQVQGDQARLQQIVWNLLSNAIKFTPEGGQVEVRLNAVGDQAQLTVTDSGKGISPQFLPHLFQSFRQEDVSITRQYGGLGLGLSIVKYLVDAHGGTIVADSAGEGQGATFTVQIPLLKLALSPLSPIPLSSKGGDLSGLKVLAVDDSQDTRELLALLLAQYGAEVQVVASGAAVLALWDSFRPNVLVCDIGMPEMDGYALLQSIRALPVEQGGAVPAIAVTAFAHQDDCQRALDNGFQRHIAKPIEPERLAIAIAELAMPRHLVEE